MLATPSWVRYWLFFSGLIVIWDAGYLLLRPHSMPGGSLAHLWKPYQLYQTVDLIYSDERWKTGDRFGEAQAVCNLVEVALQFLSLYLMWKADRPGGSLVNRQKMAATGMLLAFMTQSFTLWKTALYWLYDILGGFAHTGHNDHFNLIFVYLIPNSLWIIVPLMVMRSLAKKVLTAMAISASKAE